MRINLIPACESGVPYGADLLRTAINRFRKQLLAVIVVCPDERFEYTGANATPANLTRANITEAIVLFREPGTIGQVTGFILEKGINIHLSGTGGAYGQEFMECLTKHKIQPWFYPTNAVLERMADWSEQGDDFDLGSLPTYQRLEYWERFLVDEIAPHLYTEVLDIFGAKRTGTWQDSWAGDDT